MKKRILITAVLTCVILTGCSVKRSKKTVPVKYDITVEGSIFGGKSDDRIETEVSFDVGWVTEDDNTKYNGELARFAAVLSDDVYFRTKDLDKGTQNRVLYKDENPDEYDWTSFLKNAGFTDVQYIESYKKKEYAYDGNDSVTLLLAHTVTENGYDLYVVSLRGCFSVQEWISVFDPGCEGGAYESLTGEHPEWTDKTAFKGLDIAKNRALEFIDAFMGEYNDPELKDCIFVTGHSRGGALANMIGAEMEDRENVRSYTYTFSSPAVTTNESAAEYGTIFNIFDTNDYYTDPIPFGEEKFYRYGKNVSVSITDSDEIRGEIAKIKGRDDFASLDAAAKAEFARLFGQRFPTRASLYEMNKVTQVFDSSEEAQARAEQCLTLISSDGGFGLEGLCSVETCENDGKYEVSMYYCGGAVLISYARSLAYGKTAYDAAVSLFEEDTAACEILTLLMNNADGLSGGHLLINGFVLSGYYKQ